MYINVPYFRDKKHGTIRPPTVYNTLEAAVEAAHKYLLDIYKYETVFELSIYPIADLDDALNALDLNVIDKLDCNSCTDVEGANYIVTKDDGYSTFSVAIFKVLY